MFRKLRNKFLFLNMAVTSLVMLTAFGVVYLTTYSSAKAEIEKKLNNVTGSFVVGESVGPDNSGANPPDKGMTTGPLVSSNKVTSDYAPSFIITVDSSGNVIDINSMIDIPIEQYEEAAKTAWHQKNVSAIPIVGRSWMYKIAPMQITHMQNGHQILTESDDQFQILFLDVTDMQNNLKNLALTFLFVGIGMLAVIFVISIFYANRSIKPISENWKKQKQFVADASHELKTPLTRIILNGGVMKTNENETIKSQEEWLDAILIGADKMSKLVNNLLTLAKTEDISVQEEKQHFDITHLVRDIIESMETATKTKNLCVSSKVEFNGDIYGYKESVRQVLTILYDNAVKYTNVGGRIDVSVQQIKKSVRCSVKNMGNGIPPKDLPYIFDRFYRADEARSDDENSFGLGLSIAKNVSEQIGGSITVKSVENGWTEFVFTFET